MTADESYPSYTQRILNGDISFHRVLASHVEELTPTYLRRIDSEREVQGLLNSDSLTAYPIFLHMSKWLDGHFLSTEESRRPAQRCGCMWVPCTTKLSQTLE